MSVMGVVGAGVLILVAWIGVGVVWHLAFLAFGLRFEERGSARRRARAARAPTAAATSPVAYFRERGRGFPGF